MGANQLQFVAAQAPRLVEDGARDAILPMSCSSPASPAQATGSAPAGQLHHLAFISTHGDRVHIGVIVDAFKACEADKGIGACDRSRNVVDQRADLFELQGTAHAGGLNISTTAVLARERFPGRRPARLSCWWGWSKSLRSAFLAAGLSLVAARSKVALQPGGAPDIRLSVIRAVLPERSFFTAGGQVELIAFQHD